LKLLLAGFDTRAVAESAARAGCSFISLDSFGDLDHALLCPVYSPHHPLPGFPVGGGSNMERLAEWGIFLARQGAWDSLVYGSGFENRTELLSALLEGGSRLIGNSLESIEDVRDPVALSQALQRDGYHAPKTYPSDGRQHDLGSSWLIKPQKSGGGRGVRLKNPGEAVPEGCICQEYIAGRQCSFTFVADGRDAFVLGITEQLTGTRSFNGREFGYAGSLFPLEVDEPKKVFTAAAWIASWLTASYGLRGLNGVDFIFDGENCWVIEVNPRYSASMELLDLAYGVSLFEFHMLASGGKWQDVKQLVGRLPIEQTFYQPRSIWGKKVIYTRSNVRIRPLQPDQYGSEWEWAHGMHKLGLRDLPFPGEVIPAGNPVATAVAWGWCKTECLERLELTSQLMRNQLDPVD
jgi:predicted ATP-grasp superfamily ATP-dependent carboligase